MCVLHSGHLVYLWLLFYSDFLPQYCTGISYNLESINRKGNGEIKSQPHPSYPNHLQMWLQQPGRPNITQQQMFSHVSKYIIQGETCHIYWQYYAIRLLLVLQKCPIMYNVSFYIHWNLLKLILDGAPVVRSTSAALLLTFQTTETTFALARIITHTLH